MILSPDQIEIQKRIETWRTQISLLESHKNVKLITAKQYAESLTNIVNQIEQTEKELGLEPPFMDAHEVLFVDGSQLDEKLKEFEDMWFDKQVHEELEKI